MGITVKKMGFKAVVSTVLVLCFLFLAFTGALLYFGKTGVVLGISRNTLRVAHFWAAVFICAMIILHVIVNWRIYLAELRSLFVKTNRRDK